MLRERNWELWADMKARLFSGHCKEVQPARVGLPIQDSKPTAEWGCWPLSFMPSFMVMLTYVVYKIVRVGQYYLVSSVSRDNLCRSACQNLELSGKWMFKCFSHTQKNVNLFLY